MENPNPTQSLSEVMFEAGRQDVIAHLRSIYKRQNENILER